MSGTMRAVILAGGMGTRLAEQTDIRPKPMVEVGGRPILWHILKGYASGGVNHFVIALGYKAEVIKGYFATYHDLASDLRIETKTGRLERRSDGPDDWVVDLVDTGLHTNTGGRLRRLKDWLPDEDFCLTYGDGVADVDIRALLAFHRAHGKLVTITAVRPPARFGGLILEGDFVTEFSEKSQTNVGWINGGFMVVRREVLALLAGDDESFERDHLEDLARDGQLMAFKHDGYFQPMDTLRDVRTLQSLWDSGQAPWKTW